MVDEAVNLFNAGGTPDFRRNSYEELCSFRITLDQRARLLREHKKLPATDSLLTKDKHINFRKLKLDDIYIPKDMFEKADFSYSSLGKRDITEHDLSQVIFENSSMQLDFSRLSDDERDIILFFNHHNNTKRTPLTALQSINNRFADLKIQLAYEIIEELSRQHIILQQLVSTALPILEVFSKEPFIFDSKIREWLASIINECLQPYNHPGADKNVTSLLHEAEKLFSFLENHTIFQTRDNPTFHYLIDAFSGIDSFDKKLAARAQLSYHRYLNKSRAAPYTRFEHFDRSNPLSEPALVNLLESDAVNLVLLPVNSDGPVLLMSLDTMRGMLRPDPLNPVWNHFYQMSTPHSCLRMVDINLENLFRRDFPQFLAPFLAESQKISFGRLLNLLELGEFREAFVRATEKKNSSEKMVDNEIQIALEAQFHHVLSPGKEWSQLTSQHVQAILEAFEIADAFPRAKAEYFLCLAGVFARLSSSFYFGTEDSSPVTLRAYAHALMLQAAEFSHEIFASKKQFTDWQNRFQNRSTVVNTYDCTAELSRKMLKHAGIVCPQTLAAVRPLAWS